MPVPRIMERCRRLATLSETPHQLRRTFLSPPMREVHRLLCEWMSAAGMQVRIDAIGNVLGLYAGPRDSAPRLLIGSHVDTVPDAGAYDGVLGVMLAIELVASLDGRTLPFAIEVAAFSEEEGVRFGVPFLGSRALAGTLDADVLAVKDDAGVSVEEAIRSFGLDPACLPGARMSSCPFAYLEFHIEQGPVLELAGVPIGVVTSILGQSRRTVHFTGQARHAGTTPMRVRRDALAGAARWIVLVERYARSVPGLVATVGAMEVLPGAGNVVPGSVRLSLDVRHQEDAVRRRAVNHLLEAARVVAARRELTVEVETQLDAAATCCDSALLATLSRAVASAGVPVYTLPSGAGHDAMILAPLMPIAMLFVRSPGGISHHPDESVHTDDVEAAFEAGRAFLKELERCHA